MSRDFRFPVRFSTAIVFCMSVIACQPNQTEQSYQSDQDALPLVGAASARGPNVDVEHSLTENIAHSEDLIAPVDIHKTRAVIKNANGHILLSSSTQGNADQGWSVNGECSNGDVSLNTGGGHRHFLLLETGCELMQVSDTDAVNSSAISLQFSVAADSSFNDPSVYLQAQIVGVLGSGDIQILKSEKINLDEGTKDWQKKQILLNFDESIMPGTTRVGVRFKAAGDTGFTWYLSDVAIDVFSIGHDNGTQFSDSWADTCNQIWVGSNYWANRNRDWHVVDGRLESRNRSLYRPLRTAHRITSHMSAAPENFRFSVSTGALSKEAGDAFSGILLGAGNGLDYRAAALIHNRSGRNGGLIAGFGKYGRVFIHDNGVADNVIAEGKQSKSSAVGVTLKIVGEYSGNQMYQLSVFARDSTDKIISAVTAEVPAARLLGNIALVSNAGSLDTGHWFDQFIGAGAKLKEVPERGFGPVLMSTYTVSRDTLTLNAQFPQMCVDNYDAPKLSVNKDGQWLELAAADIDPAAFVARFIVTDWDASAEALYRVELQSSSSGTPPYYYYGRIRAAPVEADDFILATFNCRPGVLLSDAEGWIQQNNLDPFTWSAERIGYPHAELMANADKHNGDMLAFLGDQLYEFDPNGLIDASDTEALIEDYFWKWQQFVFTVREYTRSTPSFIIPDDHDVYQGNVWGAGGLAANEDEDGGYVFPSEFVQIVQKTQTGSLPRSNDTETVAQGIDVYFTDIVYGGVGIAVLEDRKFKSSPRTPGSEAVLLGDRQLSFLDTWARDWDNQQLKLVVSQSPFTQSTTHSGANSTPIHLDKDSNGWPKHGRDKAIVAIRKAFAPHVSGDQHLGMSLKHGVVVQNDAVYSFSGPSMLNIFPRVWNPLNEAAGQGDKSSEYQGEFTDAHGNLINVLAAANPDSYYLPPTERSRHKDQLGIGYGIVRMNKAQRSYEFSAWPANVDPDAADAKPYSGWPVLGNQTDNDGRAPAGFLPERTALVTDPAVVVVNEATGELVYSRRYASSTIVLPIFDASVSYTVQISDTASGYREQFSGQIAE